MSITIGTNLEDGANAVLEERRPQSITVGINLEDGANADLEERRLSHLIRFDISLV